jgi:hypothetical protein
LWVVPLGLYLLTFIVAFGKPPAWVHRLAVALMPILILTLVALMCSKAAGASSKAIFQSPRLIIPLHLIVFFFIALVFHGELARRRPDASHLTEFYWWVSLGGVAGGVFNALVAPAVFSTLAEYSVTLVLAGLLMPAWVMPRFLQALALRKQTSALQRPSRKVFVQNPGKQLHRQPAGHMTWLLDLALPLAVGLLTLALVDLGWNFDPLLQYGLPAVLCSAFLTRPRRFGLGVGAILLVSTFYAKPGFRLLHQERNFFGTMRVLADDKDEIRWFHHGTTLHGSQWRFSPAARRIPRAYYYPNSPIAQVFEVFRGTPKKRKVAVCGLGVGALAAYCETGEEFAFFEIDPAVERVTRSHFTYLADARGTCRVVIGDARLALQREPDHSFGIIVLDAFASDAVPVHLLTREAVAVYLSKLAEDGVIAVNISNWLLDLEPVVRGAAAANHLVSRAKYDIHLDPADFRQGKSGSIWMLLARDAQHLGRIATQPRWLARGAREPILWSDHYSNVLEIVRWD